MVHQIGSRRLHQLAALTEVVFAGTDGPVGLGKRRVRAAGIPARRVGMTKVMIEFVRDSRPTRIRVTCPSGNWRYPCGARDGTRHHPHIVATGALHGAEPGRLFSPGEWKRLRFPGFPGGPGLSHAPRETRRNFDILPFQRKPVNFSR